MKTGIRVSLLWVLAMALAVLVGAACLLPMRSAPSVEVVEEVEEVFVPVAAAPSAIQAVESLLEDPSWGEAMPAPLGCSLPNGVVSAAAAGVWVSVMPTGEGAAALAKLDKCATSISTTGAVKTVGANVLTSRFFFFNVGDMVIATQESDPTSLISRAQEVGVSSGCANLYPSAEDARRNPRSADYLEFTIEEKVTIKGAGRTIVPEADVTQLLAASSPTSVPDGLEGPPAPSAVAKPAELVWPGAEPVTATVTVPAVDVIGPGCGWSFTGQLPPVVNEVDIEARRLAIVEKGEEELAALNAAWQGEADVFEAALPKYLEESSKWNVYVADLTQVQTVWSTQLSALEQYQNLLNIWNDQRTQLEEWQKAFDAATKEWDKAIDKCLQEAQSGLEAGWDLGSFNCDIPKPEALTAPQPEVGSEPAKPTLWPDMY